MKFIIETSRVPIYHRIAIAFHNALIKHGHTVNLIEAQNKDDQQYINILNETEFDYYLSTNELNKIQQISTLTGNYFFENINRKIIFIHHDNIFSCIHNLSEIEKKIRALQSIQTRTKHLCIEESNVSLLQSYEITNVHKISHATEFDLTPALNTTEGNNHVSFVGHVMANLTTYPFRQIPNGLRLFGFAWERLCNSSYPIQPRMNEHIMHQINNNQIGNQEIQPLVQFNIGNLNKLSSAFRGELISKIEKARFEIVGGDLSYGAINDPLMKVNKENVFYSSATQDYQATSSIYNSRKINLNISSLQFDSAVNNRFFDIVASGGFVLTDKRDDLKHITELASYITYESPESLNELISYYLDPSNLGKYNEIKFSLNQELRNKFNYNNVIEIITQ
jgi:spore maturation protein CgeB